MSLIDMHTCVTCRVVFRDNEIQREHYKSDWHRYNLKRKVAQLPSVSAEEFNNRVLQQRTKAEESSQNKSQYCDPCRKSFANENSYANHLNSKRHKDSLLVQDEPRDKVATKAEPEDEPDSEIEEVDSDEWNEQPFCDNQCLFCSHRSRSVVRNLRHMSEAHSFFVPDVEYCVDIGGLVSYLSAKVYEGFMCLWCNDSGRAFRSAEAAQSHMLDKGHSKLLHEGAALAEYAEFYDYSSSWPGGAEDPDEEVPAAQELDGADYQLVLPSGAVIGHRSLLRYYRQRLDDTRVVPVARAPQGRLHRVLAHYRAAGWTAAQQAQVVKRAKDVHYMRRVQAKWHMKLGVKANKMQTHYRPQVLF